MGMSVLMEMEAAMEEAVSTQCTVARSPRLEACQGTDRTVKRAAAIWDGGHERTRARVQIWGVYVTQRVGVLSNAAAAQDVG